MPRLSIPATQHSGFRALLGLTPEQMTDLQSALQNAPLRLYQFQLAEAVADLTSSIDKDVVSEIVEVLWGVEFLRVSFDAPRDAFLDDIIEAAAYADLGGKEALHKLKPQLGVLLQSHALATAAKARALLTDGNSYCSARILTDVRPVFGETVEEEPRATLIVHHLTLSYHTGGSDRADTIISLESSDIDDLMEILERAKEKERRLRAVLDRAGMSLLDSE